VRSTTSFNLDPTVYARAGLCPAGDVNFIDDRYTNLDTRTAAGIDVALDYTLRTDLGRFSVRYAASFMTDLEQLAGGLAGDLVAAQQAGTLPGNYPVDGFANLLGMDGNPRNRQNLTLSWRKGDWSASLSGFRIGSVYDSGLTLPNGTRWVLPAMTTGNATVDYRFELSGVNSRVRFGVNNFTNERAPLADDFFGYMSDVHSDYGRHYYLDLRLNFGK
jgi:hypothetical protein